MFVAHPVIRAASLNHHLVRSSALSAALLGATLLVPSIGSALPQGGAVQGGNVTIGAPTGNKLTVDQTSQRGAINWNSFDINKGETVRFNQPNASAITLNRVDAATAPSQILGNLSANGQVIVSNPNGVVFGANSRTDVAGLIATTAKTDTASFMNTANRFDFSQKGAKDGAIKVDKGALITAKDGGLVALVAPEVTNEGLIVANQGKVALAGGEVASFDIYGDGLVSFAISRGDGHVTQGGVINAHGGQVVLTAKDTRNLVDAVVSPTGIEEAASLNGGVLLASGSQIDVNGVNGGAAGTVRVDAENIAAQDNARIDASVVPFQLANLSPAAGKVSLKADNLALAEGSKIKAIGGTGGQVSLASNQMLLAGDIDTRGAAGARGNLAVETDGDIVINNGEQDGQMGHVGENWIERSSNRGNNVTLATRTGDITLADLDDNVLAGGNGSITLRALSNDSAITFEQPRGDRIYTTGGDINLSAGSGGLLIGDLLTGQVDFASLTKDQPDGAVIAGSINLRTVNGGDIDARNLRAFGTSATTGITAYADGDFNALSATIRVQDLPEPGGDGRAVITMRAKGDINVENDVFASALDKQGNNQNTFASIRMVADGDVTVGGTVRAQSAAGFPRDTRNVGAAYSDVLISGDTVTLGKVDSTADAGDAALSEVRIDARTALNANDDIVSYATVSPDSTKSGGVSLEDRTVSVNGTPLERRNPLGQLQIRSPQTNVLITDKNITFGASTNVRVDGNTNLGGNTVGNITVTTRDEPNFTNNPNPDFEFARSDRAFALNAGNSVVVTGDIESVLADINANAGAGGIQLANVTTGDAAYVDNLTFYDGIGGAGTPGRNGAMTPGKIRLTTTGGGDITMGNLNLDGTYSDGGTAGPDRRFLLANPDNTLDVQTPVSSIIVNSSGSIRTGGVRARIEDKADRGTTGLVRVALNAVRDLFVDGDVSARAIGDQGRFRDAYADVALTSGATNTLQVSGNVESTAVGFINESGPLDQARNSGAQAVFTGGTIDLNDVTVSALGSDNATSYLFVNAANQASIGSLLARSYTVGNVPANLSQLFTTGTQGSPINAGNAYATLELRTPGTIASNAVNGNAPYPTDLVYKADDPRAEANAALRQGKYTDSETVNGDTARLIIVPIAGTVTPQPPTNPGGGGGGGTPGTPTPPVTPVAPTPPVTVAPTPTPPVVANIQQIEADRTLPLSTALYSYFGETTGDAFYFGNTDVNITLLGAPSINAATSLAGLAPAAGPGATSDSDDEQQRAARTTVSNEGSLVGPGTNASPAFDTATAGPVIRKVGGSDAKRARYIWPKFTGEQSAEYAANAELDAANPAPARSDSDLGNLAPAAGGNVEAAALAQLDPAAGGSGGACGNNFLDAGYSTSFNEQECRQEAQ